MVMVDSDTNPNAKLLEYYQSIIARMAANSSSVKGWAVSVVTAVVGFGVKDGPRELAYLALLPSVLFFALDAYYLAAERAYRAEYNTAATQATPLPMTISGGLVTPSRWMRGALRPVTWSVYLVLVLVAIAIGTGWLALGTPTQK
jgi:hypothetical protein